MKNVAKAFKITGIALLAGPFVLGAIGALLSFLLGCDITSKGAAAVVCPTGKPSLEANLTLLVNMPLFAMITTIPSLSVWLVGYFLTPKKGPVTHTSNTPSGTEVHISKIGKYILIAFVVYFILDFLYKIVV